MIWLAWRQHRKQALFTGIGLVVLAALMLPTGLAMHSAYTGKGLGACLKQMADPSTAQAKVDGCHYAMDQFTNRYSSMMFIGILLLLLPLLIGLFWGSPLVAREVEHGTHRLVWTQGISRTRWAAVKFGAVGGLAVVVGLAYGLGMSWWLQPLTSVGEQSRFQQFLFDMSGIAPVGYTLFAVALGIFVGTLWRRVLPAMAVTLAAFVVVRLLLTALARPRYLPAKTLTYPLEGPGRLSQTSPEDWILARGIRDVAGKLIAPGAEIRCPVGAAGPDGGGCGTPLGIGKGAYNWLSYQPASRYWLFQGIETGIFVALAAGLLLLAFRQVRRIA
ncbi:ABC transporter permease [Angustibacter luteus]|uniref:ABC transporter permease n=1 Tax=Angustibacter luteus TaxID=658456 RepID=A0ABW1JGW6_9ACTN